VIISPYDSATTAWVVRTASSIERVIEREFVTVHPDERIADVRKKFSVTNHALLVTNDDGALIGILTKSDIFKPVQTRLVLVDHNELTQAVPGAEEVTITEIIDHHRLGALHTAQPILFINEPVGSTCTIIADLYRRENLQPTPAIAGIMMSGLISDTLHLNGPTTTGKDAAILAWLGKIAGVDSKKLADEIFNSGSVILAQPPEKVVRSDFKIYEEEGIRYAVSQVEELGFGNFWQHAKPIAGAVRELRDEERLAFAALLITDINTQNSLLLVKGDSAIIERIGYPHVEQKRNLRPPRRCEPQEAAHPLPHEPDQGTRRRRRAANGEERGAVSEEKEVKGANQLSAFSCTVGAQTCCAPIYSDRKQIRAQQDCAPTELIAESLTASDMDRLSRRRAAAASINASLNVGCAWYRAVHFVHVAFHVHREHVFRDQLRGLVADDVRAVDFARLRIGDHLYEAFGVARGDRLA
jgi:inorganic pyrophosphatase/exopolyphosphatase